MSKEKKQSLLEAPGNTGNDSPAPILPKAPIPQPFQPRVKETFWTQDGQVIAPDAEDVAKAAIGIVERVTQQADATKAVGGYVADSRIKEAVVQRIAPGRVPLYDLQGNGRLIHKQSMVSLLRLGFSLQCNLCGAHHVFVDEQGRRWFDTSPNACPAKPKRNYTECPICPMFGRRKVTFDVLPAKDQETWKEHGVEALYIPYDVLGVKTTLYGVLSSHVWAKHPDEARIFRWAEPPRAPAGAMSG